MTKREKKKFTAKVKSKEFLSKVKSRPEKLFEKPAEETDIDYRKKQYIMCKQIYNKNCLSEGGYKLHCKKGAQEFCDARYYSAKVARVEELWHGIGD